MTSNNTETRALVLGGGGVAGVAWELGILLSLHDKGVDVRNADLIIGTSAGSVVGAQIASGVDLESLFAAQLTPPEQSKERNVPFDPAQMVEAFSKAIAGAGPDIKAIRARIGAYALSAPTIPEAERRAIIESRLPTRTWPQQLLLIVAVDTETGEEYLIDRESGVPLVDAVAASCAVPGVWPPVILNPLGANANAFGPGGPASEAAALKCEGSQVLVIEPDTASTAAIGPNPLDPATREPSARAGRAQGHELAATVAAFWS